MNKELFYWITALVESIVIWLLLVMLYHPKQTAKIRKLLHMPYQDLLNINSSKKKTPTPPIAPISTATSESTPKAKLANAPIIIPDNKNSNKSLITSDTDIFYRK